MALAGLPGRARRGSRSCSSLGKSKGTPLTKSVSLVNLQGTQNRLREILLGKGVNDPFTTAGGRRNPVQANDPGLETVGEDLSELSPPPSPPHGDSSCASTVHDSPKARGTVSYKDEKDNPRPAFGDNREKEAFVTQICTETTRLDVRDWISRIYEILKNKPQKDEEEGQGKGKRHGNRNRAWSNSGHSDTTTTHTATTSALLTAGGNSVIGGQSKSASRKAPSLMSAESMIVHPGRKIEVLSTEERLRAYLRHEIPELTAYVNKHVAMRAEQLRKEVDEELVESHMLQMRRQQVFDSKANFLRWQNTRRIALLQRLDSETPFWMLEAVQSWDQKGAMKAREEEVSEQDLVFDYLTKRAAHINTSKLASEIPLFKALHSSYSLPRMWRDKYLEMF